MSTREINWLILGLAVITAIGLFAGCDESTFDVHVCTCEQADSVAAFVERNIEPANNRSDEEMEDVIRELYDAAVALRCEVVEVENIHTLPVPYDTGCWRVATRPRGW